MRGALQDIDLSGCQGSAWRVGIVCLLALLAGIMLFPASPVFAQQLPWLTEPAQGAPSAVTIVPKTPMRPRAPMRPQAPLARVAPPAPAAAAPQPSSMMPPAPAMPSPVMPVPNAPVAGTQVPQPAIQAAPAFRPAMPPSAPAAPMPPAIPGVPAWLTPHIGEGDGKIALAVFKRAQAYHQKKRRSGAVKNSCYFAFDATRPGAGGKRFYVICENAKTFRAVASGHGAGRNFEKLADVSNNARCAKNFSNARNSHLTTGGGYTTAEIRTSFKGYYSGASGYQPLMRSFLQYTGEGDTANARDRAIGGHSAAIVRWSCRMKMPRSEYADRSGYVPYGKLVDYSAGRSSGCTSWPREVDAQILKIAKNNPTTVYVYPEAKDIVAVGRAVRAGQSPGRAGLYWNASCLKEIGEPNFWPREKLEPALLQLAKKRKPGKARTVADLPVCKTASSAAR
ncbi:MAG: murein L,D-transpeptidase catalytic domain-containing protein [Pseudomonadota bacterium]